MLEDVYSAFVTTASSAAQFAATLTNLSAFTITNARSLRKALSDEQVRDIATITTAWRLRIDRKD